MSYTHCFFHIIFRTKHSAPVIDPRYERELYTLVWEFCKSRRVFLRRVNGMKEHLHLGAGLPPTYSVADFVRDLKSYTSLALKQNPHFPGFNGWADGYCALSYGKEAVPNVINYIARQKEHHSTVSFNDEIVDLIKQTGMEIKEEYFKKDWLD